MSPINLAIVGVGKIVRDQHLPSIAKNPDFALVATASRHGTVEGVKSYTTIEAMLDAEPSIDAVSLCMPPQYRYEAAYKALVAGKHVFLEKPPGATLSEVADLEALASKQGASLFASWHSRYAPAVEAAKAFLASTTIKSVHVIWKEDVRHWHPNQEWIWQAGGLGVFDPGINALSIVTHILPRPIFITEAVLEFPENRDAPIAADIHFRNADGLPVHAEFDWLQTGKQSWDIVAETAAGQMVLAEGGAKLLIDGALRFAEPEQEYPSLYRRFAEIIKAGKSDVDLAPLRHVADAFMLGKRKFVDAFHD
ncbi:Gfo/Idh/MocA family protein [Rhizobium leguminosarum]|jgi:D-galactose 1-dehydrogenase|uniref:Gfo/Idh/MocA family oxidoreductase n=1 Tax=Rhizobium indigoferae TaxID=158891 RepID=A0ABZ0ZC46_9HYPH|nr:MULTISPECIES: Gfo/Idh/MocA family oxidoreductase [Rhizobium]MCJ9696494.1 Gfo/Idh/MocA family oxidoreductase [Rhizobium sp. PRIMUS64]NKJ90344.1 gfo/Idh/MocA family oxidoreductase [Rhizobium leguminosarum bv. viciae]NNU57127.1 Gfo/Idh/MocA family oxidoreductase [Rhizobium indigoferae]QIO57677.1 Gfo/Idh/MocA family oxidoreductase [Rhizobium leguminosarum bv. trifolii]TBZ70712.1 Gfo/Idh/MocA family oxidoreductase [Rhizobium leguminosarum bv. viciae]